MKKLLHTFIYTLIIQSLLMGHTMAASRVDDIFAEDEEQAVQDIYIKKIELKDQRSELKSIDKHIRSTKKGESIYLKLESLAGSMVVVGILVGVRKAYFPPGMRAMLASYITVTALSHSLIKLSSDEVTHLLASITKLQARLDLAEKNLNAKLKFYCRNHEYALCFSPI